MKRRVWVYLYPPELKFLSSLGELIGTNSRHEQMEFVVKLCRLMVPEARIIPQILSNLQLLPPAAPREGRAVRTWVYLSDDDIWYIEEFMSGFGLTSRSRAMRYLIHITRMLLARTNAVTKEVIKILGD